MANFIHLFTDKATVTTIADKDQDENGELIDSDGTTVEKTTAQIAGQVAEAIQNKRVFKVIITQQD